VLHQVGEKHGAVDGLGVGLVIGEDVLPSLGATLRRLDER
jgi:hypothetical protein